MPNPTRRMAPLDATGSDRPRQAAAIVIDSSRHAATSTFTVLDGRRLFWAMGGEASRQAARGRLHLLSADPTAHRSLLVLRHSKHFDDPGARGNTGRLYFGLADDGDL